MTRRIVLLPLLILSAVASAQDAGPDGLFWSLPVHPGKLSLSQGSFQVNELSAKSNNGELGIRAVAGDLNLLGFMFLWPEKPNLDAAMCRDEMLKSEGTSALAADKGRMAMTSASGVPIALVLMIPADGKQSAIRAFVAAGDLCGDLLFSIHQPVTKQSIPMQQVKDILSTLRFDPQSVPTFRDAFRYATVEWDKHQLKGAADAYKAALKRVDSSDDPVKWRRVTTDQLTMALGMSGDIAQSRSINQAAIAKDPAYTLYYYNLACADAEEGNASGARTHLQEAFDRRKNVIAGENLADPSTDDSLMKLKADKEFWKFVLDISAKLKKG